MHPVRFATPIATLALCLSAAAGPATAVEPSSAALPPLVDVPEYRANASRNSIYPGPGPVEEPVQVWSRSIDGPISFNAVLADGKILFGGGDSTFYALDARTGKEVWRFAAAAGFNGWGSAADGTVVATSDDGTLHALDLATGAERWNRAGFATGTTIVDGVVYAPGTNNDARGLDLATGEEVWAWAAPAPVAALTVVDGTAYASVGDGRLYAIALADGVERWDVQTLAASPRVAEIDGDTVVASGATWETPVGELYVIDRDSGTVRWRFRLASGSMITAGATAHGVSYSGSWDGSGLYAFPTTADPSGGAPPPLWHTPVPASAYKNQALASGMLYVPTEGPNEVLAVGADDGAIRWRLPMADVPNSTMADGGMLFVSDASGTISVWAEPAIRDIIGETVSGPLYAQVATVDLPPDPFTVIGTLEPSTTGLHTGLAFDIGPDGLIYALDMKPSVTVIDPATGKVVRTWGRLGTGEGEFDLRANDGNGNPGVGDIDVGADGLVYVADGANHRVQVFQPDGTFVRQMGSFGSHDGQFSRTHYIASDAHGDLYVEDEDNGALTKFGPDGGFLWRDSAPGLTSHIPAVLADGTVASLRDPGQVLTLDAASGAVVDRWDNPGLAPGEIGNPCNIAVDGAGNQYIFSCAPGRLQVFDAEHRLIGAEYESQGDRAFEPVFGPNGEVYATAWFTSDNIYILKDRLLTP